MVVYTSIVDIAQGQVDSVYYYVSVREYEIHFVELFCIFEYIAEKRHLQK